MLVNDLTVLHLVHRHFLHLAPLACRLERRVEDVVHRELILADEWSVDFDAVNLVVLLPPYAAVSRIFSAGFESTTVRDSYVSALEI